MSREHYQPRAGRPTRQQLAAREDAADGPDYDGPEGGHSTRASPARMAVLRYLAKHPSGVPVADIALAIGAALGDPLSDHDTHLVINALRRDRMIQGDRTTGEAPVLYYSCGSRLAYWVRRGKPGNDAPPPAGPQRRTVVVDVRPRPTLADAPVLSELME